MVDVTDIGVGLFTVLISVLASGFLSWRISKGELQLEYDWERYSKAEEWCDDFLRLVREIQANYEYKAGIMQDGWWEPGMAIPGDDLDDYGIKLRKHLAQRPVIIFNLLDTPEKEEGISGEVGKMSIYCGVLADENLEKMGDDAPQQFDDLREELYSISEEFVDNLMKLRNEDLKADFQE